MEKKELKCMRCGRERHDGESFNANRDKTFVVCDECMWNSPSPRPTGEEEWDKFVSFVHSRSAIAFNGSYSENGKVLISIKTLTDYLSFVREEERQEQLSIAREEGTFTKEELQYLKEMIEEYTGLYKYNIEDIRLVNPILYKICNSLSNQSKEK